MEKDGRRCCPDFKDQRKSVAGMCWSSCSISTVGPVYCCCRCRGAVGSKLL